MNQVMSDCCLICEDGAPGGWQTKLRHKTDASWHICEGWALNAEHHALSVEQQRFVGRVLPSITNCNGSATNATDCVTTTPRHKKVINWLCIIGHCSDFARDVEHLSLHQWIHSRSSLFQALLRTPNQNFQLPIFYILKNFQNRFNKFDLLGESINSIIFVCFMEVNHQNHISFSISYPDTSKNI